MHQHAMYTYAHLYTCTYAKTMVVLELDLHVAGGRKPSPVIFLSRTVCIRTRVYRSWWRWARPPRRGGQKAVAVAVPHISLPTCSSPVRSFTHILAATAIKPLPVPCSKTCVLSETICKPLASPLPFRFKGRTTFLKNKCSAQ